MSGELLILLALTAFHWPWLGMERPSGTPAVVIEPESEFLKILQPNETPAEPLLPPTSAELAWMTDRTLFSPEMVIPRFEVGQLGEVLDRQMGGLRLGGSTGGTRGFLNDPDRLRFNGDLSDSFYRRTVKIEVPNPEVSSLPFAGRNWTSEDRFQIPVPIALPIAEQMFVYGQFGGNGDAYNNRTTTLSGKTGVGMKWSPLGGTEFQVRYGTLLNYADVYSTTRFQERAQPAVELVAKLPLAGAWKIEYTGAALPALQATSRDQIRQELKLALPLGGENTFEFGARYRWDVISTPAQAAAQSPWIDRAQLFMGVKFRR